MMGFRVILSLGLLALVHCEIPEYIHVCHRRDPKVTACIKESIEYLRPQLARGLPELNVPGIDPLHLEKITIYEGNDGNGLYAYLNNVAVSGASNFKMTKLKLDIDKVTYRLGVQIPFLDLVGNYDINVRLFQNPVKEGGQFHANISGIDAQAILQGQVENNHLVFKTVVFKIRVEDFNIDLGTLFQSNPTIQQLVQNMLANSKNDIIQMALPIIEKKLASYLLELGNKITKNLDYDEVFPE